MIASLVEKRRRPAIMAERLDRADWSLVRDNRRIGEVSGLAPSTRTQAVQHHQHAHQRQAQTHPDSARVLPISRIPHHSADYDCRYANPEGAPHLATKTAGKRLSLERSESASAIVGQRLDDETVGGAKRLQQGRLERAFGAKRMGGHQPRAITAQRLPVARLRYLEPDAVEREGNLGPVDALPSTRCG